MKKIIPLLLISIAIFCANLSSACSLTDDPIRIHIRANSNVEVDQSVKLIVKDAVVSYLSTTLDNAHNRDTALALLESETDNVIRICDFVLSSQGFNYTASASLNYEYFPLRTYNGDVYDSGYYDAFIVELGTGQGENWWCVAYPPLCFYGNSNVEYTSFILEFLGLA